MRGKVARNELRALQYGITPAYAGKSFPFFGIIRLHWDHPRICGEKLISVKGESRPVGSPPHMRGKAASPFAFTIFIRITPAYAGKSKCQVWHGQSREDHPRICGEKHGPPPRLPLFLGSPPHMRGKDIRGVVQNVLFGITPAYAGKRTSLPIGRFRTGDHPRICGEKLPREAAAGVPKGSPPHMRGKVIFLLVRLCKVRITPAYAGKRAPSAAASGLCWDHPRICGEKCVKRQFDILLSGITPAYAGKRLKRSRSTVPPVAIVPLFPSVCNKPVVSDGSPAGRDAPLFLPAENAVPASPAYNLRSL